jgi:hypothetical protein
VNLHQRVGAFVGYGSYGPSGRLTRTFRLDTLAMATMEEGIVPMSSPRIRVPAFARRLQVTALDLAGFAIGLFGPNPDVEPDSLYFDDTHNQATVAIPGDCASVILDNSRSPTAPSIRKARIWRPSSARLCARPAS